VVRFCLRRDCEFNRGIAWSNRSAATKGVLSIDEEVQWCVKEEEIESVVTAAVSRLTDAGSRVQSAVGKHRRQSRAL
jgi:hypothetical protein